MSREYGKIATRFWSDPRVLGLSAEAKMVFLYLLAGPETGPAGCFRVTPMHIAASEVCAPGAAQEALEELKGSGMIRYDRGASVVYLPRFLRYNTVCNASAAKAAIKSLEQTPDSPLVAEAARGLRESTDKVPADWVQRLEDLCMDKSGHVCGHMCPDECQDEGGHGCGDLSGHPLTRARAPIPSQQEPIPTHADPARAREDGSEDGTVPGEPELEVVEAVPVDDDWAAGARGRGMPSSALVDHVPAAEAAQLLASLILENDPQAELPHLIDPWVVALQRLHNGGARPWDEIQAVIRYSQADVWWRSRVMSAPDFVRNYPKLRLQAQEAASGSTRDPVASRRDRVFGVHQASDQLRTAAGGGAR